MSNSGRWNPDQLAEADETIDIKRKITSIAKQIKKAKAWVKSREDCVKQSEDANINWLAIDYNTS